ncbi:MAG: PIN domain-containing protein [Armatimonadota bacterium]|nr:PIN domain-containing protein [Armatimonadota bacterium]
MVIVDSSVWIDLLRGRETQETVAFERLAAEEEIGLGDLILYEVLQGVTPADRVEKVKSHMLTFPVFTIGGRDLVLEAVHNAQVLRAQGTQVATIDCLIATFCIVSGSRLLSSDHHFQPFTDALGLVMVG